MKAKDARQFVRDLKALCKKYNVEFEVVSSIGKGSHRGLRFRNPATEEEVTIVIPGHKEISPGVQREVLIYLGKLAVKVALAEIIRAILAHLFH